MEKNKKLNKFFTDYSENVEKAKDIWFWKLSDTIIYNIISENFKKFISDKGEITLLDAGCGTWVWIERFVNDPIFKDKKINYIWYDLFDSMLDKAKEKFKDKSNIKLIKGNIENMKEIKPNSIDFIISIYSPISFLDNPESFIQEIKRVLKKWWEALIMWHSYFSAIESKLNIYYPFNDDEIEKLMNDWLVKWNDSLPYLSTFSMEKFFYLWDKNGLINYKCYWIPVFVKPGSEDWDEKNEKKSDISKKLENEEFFNKAFELEMKYNSNLSVVNRWLNILVHYKK